MIPNALNFNRKLSIKVSEDKVKISVPVVRNYFLLALLYLVSYLWFTKSFRFLNSFLPGAIEEFTTAKGILLTVWLIFSFVLVKYLIWLIYGAETIVVNHQLLIVQKRGKLFRKRKVYEVSGINWIKIDTIDNRINGEIQTDEDGSLIEAGKIRFKYKHQLDDKGFGIGLKEEEAIDILDLLALKGILNDNLWVYRKPDDNEYYN